MSYLEPVGKALNWAAENASIALDAGMLCQEWAGIAGVNVSVASGKVLDLLVDVRGARFWPATLKRTGTLLTEVGDKKQTWTHLATRVAQCVFGATACTNIAATKFFGGTWSRLPLVQKVGDVACVALEALAAWKLWTRSSTAERAVDKPQLSLVGKCRIGAASGYVVAGTLALLRPNCKIFSTGAMACYTAEVLLGWVYGKEANFVLQKKK